MREKFVKTHFTKMEDLKTLRMKKKLLLIELKALEEKISLYEDESITVNSVPVNESLTNTHSTSGEQTDLTQGKSKAIPEQTAHGKEMSNPLTAEVLLKSLVKETTTPIPNGKTSLLIHDEINSVTEDISKMTILSSDHSKKNINLRPDYKKALGKPADRYYVIYKGPHAGIHTDWGTVETFLKVDKVTCKKFSNEAQAKLSIALAKEAESSVKKPLLKPKIQQIKPSHRDERFKVPQEIEEAVAIKPIAFEDFRILWGKIRAAGPEDLVHENFFSTDKKNKSLYNFLEGADATLIYQAFSAGLVDNIYPSSNLQELKFFPRTMVDKIKDFRKKVLKAKDSPIYIRVISSLPEWSQGDYFTPYHYMEVGLAKDKKEIPSSQMLEDNLNETVLHNQRVGGLRRIAEKIIEILSGSKKKINYTDSHCIVTSWSFSSTSQQDVNLASSYGIRFKDNTLDVSTNTKTVFCRHADELFEEHVCNFCKEDSQTKEDPSTEENLSSDNGSA